jgi:maleate isomerase
LANAEVSGMTARIGLIIPSSNRMVEEEMVRHVPPGVTAHVARLRMTGAHRVSLDALLPRVAEAAALLADARCDVIAFHCTANSTAEGLMGEVQLLGALQTAGARRVTTTASALRHAFNLIGARRVVLLTPYSQRTTDEEAAFFRGTGYEVPYAKGFALAGSDEYCATPAQFWRDRALEAARPDADVYLLSCANISTLPIIEELERKLGRPVVSSNQAMLFEALWLCDNDDRRNCCGSLFDYSIREQTQRRAFLRQTR